MNKADKEQYSHILYHRSIGEQVFFSRYAAVRMVDGKYEETALKKDDWYEEYEDDIQTDCPMITSMIYCPSCKKRHSIMEYQLGRLMTEEEKILWAKRRLVIDEKRDDQAFDIRKVLDIRYKDENASKKSGIICLPGKDSFDCMKNPVCPECGFKGSKAVIRGAASEGGRRILPAFFEIRDDGTRFSVITRSRELVPGKTLDAPIFYKRSMASISFNRETASICACGKKGIHRITMADSIPVELPLSPYFKREKEDLEDVNNTLSMLCREMGPGVEDTVNSLTEIYMNSRDYTEYEGLYHETDDEADDQDHESNDKNEFNIRIQVVMNLFRFPGLRNCIDFQYTLLKYYKRKNTRMRYNLIDEYIGKLRKAADPEGVLRVLESYGCRSLGKADKRIIYKNPFNGFAYVLGRRLGITDYNQVRDICERILFMATERNYDVLYTILKQKEMVRFLKQIYKKKGMKALKNALESEWLEDAAYMWDYLIKNGREDNLKGNMREIHDRLLWKVTGIERRNRAIPYKKDDGKLEAVIDGITFLLAKDTYELQDVGQSMGICVGTYGNDAVSRTCTIVVMRKNGKPIGCLELMQHKTGKNKRRWCLVQAKAKYNNLLQGEHALALKQYVENNSLDASSCTDYEHIREGDIRPLSEEIQHRFNYAPGVEGNNALAEDLL